MKKLLEENETLKQIFNEAGRLLARPPRRFQQSISRNVLRKIWQKNKISPEHYYFSRIATTSFKKHKAK